MLIVLHKSVTWKQERTDSLLQASRVVLYCNT